MVQFGFKAFLRSSRTLPNTLKRRCRLQAPCWQRIYPYRVGRVSQDEYIIMLVILLVEHVLIIKLPSATLSMH